MAQDYKVFPSLDGVPDEHFLVRRPDGCDCGQYRFYSAACNHVYAVVNIECAKVTWVTRDPVYCNQPAKVYDVVSWKAIDPCDECAKRAGAEATIPSTKRQ
ncbi:MAG: hypothetical protein M1835_004747 [Candelina submexicana]|nr:MAG: hypothetical protein M1835_004747 [Candelina submexicana]